MFPETSYDTSLGMRRAYAKHVAYLGIGQPRFSETSHPKNIVLREFGIQFTLASALSVLCNHIGRIVRRRTSKKMRGIHTCFVIACMANDLAVINASDKQIKRKPMREHQFAVETNFSVALGMYWANPEPTILFISSLGIVREAFSWFSHIVEMIRIYTKKIRTRGPQQAFWSSSLGRKIAISICRPSFTKRVVLTSSVCDRTNPYPAFWRLNLLFHMIKEIRHIYFPYNYTLMQTKVRYG